MTTTKKPKIAKPVWFDPKKITADPRLQTRVEGMSKDVVDGYAEVMGDGGWGNFPPLIVYHDKDAGVWWLAQGFHRLAAAVIAKLKRVLIELREGTFDDAEIESWGGNNDHGFPRTKADKRLATERAVLKYPDWTAGKIAATVHVGKDLVLDVKKTLQVSFNDSRRADQTSEESTQTGLNGKTYRQPPPSSAPSVPAAPADDLIPITDPADDDNAADDPHAPDLGDPGAKAPAAPKPHKEQRREWRFLDVLEHLGDVSEEAHRVMRVQDVATLGELAELLRHADTGLTHGATVKLKATVERVSAEYGDPFRFPTADEEAADRAARDAARLDGVRADAPKFDALAAEFRSAARRLANLANGPAGHFLVKSLNAHVPGMFVEVKVKTPGMSRLRTRWAFKGVSLFAAYLEACRPAATTCTGCHGAPGGCPRCDGQGWHPSEADPQTRRRAAEEAAGREAWDAQEAA